MSSLLRSRQPASLQAFRSDWTCPEKVALTQLDPLWEELFPAEQARIFGLLVERIDLTETGLILRIRTDGLTNITREMGRDNGVAG